MGQGRLEQTEAFLQSHGPKVLFSARFTPGLRSVVFFSSGVLQIPFRTFLFYDGMAALLSVPALVASSWYWGAEFDEVLLKARRAENGVLLTIVAIALLLLARWAWKRRKKAAEAAAK